MPPRITIEKCNGCGICIYQCGGFCLTLDYKRNKAKLSNGSECVDCFQCEARCPQEAIKISISRKRQLNK